MFEALERWLIAHSTVLNLLATWFSGVATFLAVGFALYLQRRIERRGRPRLILTASSFAGPCLRYLDPVWTAAAPGTAGHPRREELWLRLWLQNDSPTVARDVALKLIAVERDGVLESRPRWPFKLSTLDATVVDLLPRGFDQPIDIAYLRNTEGVNEDARLALVLVKAPQRPWQEEKARIEGNSFYHPLAAGHTYTIRLAAISSNADALYCKMTVTLTASSSGPLGDLCGEERLRARLMFTEPRVECSRFQLLQALRSALRNGRRPAKARSLA